MVVRRGPGGDGLAVSTLAGDYSDTGGAWEEGPARVYDRLAAVLIDRSPVPLAGGRVLDVGAGTGAASRAALAAGVAEAVGVDAAFGMLAHRATARPPAVVGDALALPFARSAFDATVAAFSLNHLPCPAAGLREMARVTRSGGAILAASYAVRRHPPGEGSGEGGPRRPRLGTGAVVRVAWRRRPTAARHPRALRRRRP